MRAEAQPQFFLERVRLKRQHALGFRGPLRPDQRGAVAGQRQDGEWAGRREMFLGPAIVRQFVFDRGDEAHLVVGPAHKLDAGGLAGR